MNLDTAFIVGDLPTVLSGLPYTLLLTACSMFWALVFAFVCGLSILSKVPVASHVARAFNTVVKGVPLVIQLLFCYYAVPYLCQAVDGLFGWRYDPRHIPYFPAAVFALAVNFGAYITDVVISSARAVDRGQREAAAACGMTGPQAFRRILLPQMALISLPGMTNYLIWLLKGTSLASIVNVVEMLTTAKLSAADGYQYFEAYICAALIYWAVCAGVEFLSGLIGKRYSMILPSSPGG